MDDAKKEQLTTLSAGRIATGAAWSLMSFGVLAVSGLLFNILLARLYGPGAVGIFNQVYSIYIVLAMIASFGIQLSSLHYVSRNINDTDLLRQIITSALALAAIISVVVVVISLLVAPLVSQVFSSNEVGSAYLWILPGVIFFAANKVLLNSINGLFKIRELSIFQSLRFILAILLLSIIVYFDLPVSVTPGCLAGAELILFILLTFYLRHYLGLLKPEHFKIWRRRHLRFGVKSVFGGVVSEANTRVDIIMLGILMSDRIVGIYSIAALVIEGIAKLVDVLRYPINPHLSREIASGRIDKLCRAIRKGVLISYGFVLFIGIIGLATYNFLPNFIIKNPEFSKSWTPFVILTVGLIIGGGYRPFNLLLSQAGYPGFQTILRLAVLVSNIVLNVILIQIFGLNGAAAATAITFMLNAAYLKLIVRKTLKKWI